MARVPAHAAREIAQSRDPYHASLLADVYTGYPPERWLYFTIALSTAAAHVPASLSTPLMPVFGTAISAIFLAEETRFYHFVGISLIFAGFI